MSSLEYHVVFVEDKTGEIDDVIIEDTVNRTHPPLAVVAAFELIQYHMKMRKESPCSCAICNRFDFLVASLRQTFLTQMPEHFLAVDKMHTADKMDA